MNVRLNSMRLLEQRSVAFVTHEFPDTILSADGVADHLGRPRSTVYKTLVVMGSSPRPMLILVAADRELDLRRAARAIGEKRLRMATQREAESATGLQVGGISALALLHKRFPVYVDRRVLALDRVLVSAGRRGVNLELHVQDLLDVIDARPIDATSDPADPASAPAEGTLA